MSRPRCSFPFCPFPATRQEYSPDYDEGDPWNAGNFVAFCAGHAGRSSWPLELSEGDQ